MGGSSSSSSNTPVEAPNSLISTGVIKITDLLCEGPIAGFVTQSGSYGSDPLTSTYFDNVPVRNLDGSYNFNVSGQGFAFYYTLGTATQTAMSGFEKTENSIPLSSNTQISNPPIGAGTPKNVTATFNTTMYPDADSVKITVNVPSLYTADDSGNIDSYVITYAIDISLNNGPFQQYEVISLNGKCTSNYLKTTSYTLPKTTPASSYYQWTVRVRRVSQDIYSVKTSNDIFVTSIAVVSSSSFVYPNSVLVGNYMLASQFASIPNRAYLINGLLVSVPNGYTPTQYNTNGTITPASYPSVWYGDFQSGIWTDNPAWVFYDLVTNKRYGLGNYMPPNSVDKWSMYQIAQYCDEMIDDGLGDGQLEPRFTCNVSITQQDDAYNVLLNLASVFRGMIYYANGTIQATQTSDKTAVYNFTNANVIDGQFNYADTAKNTRSTVALVKWVDPDNLYRENIEYIEDTEGILRYGYVEKNIAAFACSSRGQAYRLGNWALQSEKLLTETVSFKVGLEGLYVRPGDVFNIYDNFRTNRSQGGRIMSFSTGRNVIQLDRSVPIDSGVSYTLSAIVPKYTLNPEDVTNSNQIDLIRNSQIETYQVLNGITSGTKTITISGQFSTGLFPGSTWIMSASGGGNLLNNAAIYQCLSINESEPGIMEVLALQYNTGINTLVDHGYNVVSNPVNSGDQSPISPPTNLTITQITGAYTNNSFFSYLQVNWANSPSANLAYYNVSGQKFGGSWELISNTTSNHVTFGTDVTGFTKFDVAAISYGGVRSTDLTGGYTVGTNPFGYVAGVTGLRLTLGADSTYLGPDGFATGYIDKTPGFEWFVPVESNGNQVITAQFISGYKFSVLKPDGITSITSPVYLSGADNTTHTVSYSQLHQNRSFIAKVESIDQYGNVGSAATLLVNNPAPASPVSSGFGAGGNGFSYNIGQNPIDIDISGIYLWQSETVPFTPTFDNVGWVFPNTAGFASTPTSNSYNVWFSLIDSFSQTGCQIYGPIWVDALSGISGISTQYNFIQSQISGLQSEINSGAAALTGATAYFDTAIRIESGFRVTGDNQLAQLITTVSATLSGNISGASGVLQSQVTTAQQSIATTGQTLALSIQTLNSNVINATGTINANITNLQGTIATTGSALASSINSLSASVNSATGTINANITTQQNALATTGSALSAQITTLKAATGSLSATTQILADAYIVGGSAIATYGFQLDGGGKVVSMQAIAAQGGSQPTIGVIIFGGADLQSSNYVAGSNGWRIRANGDAEFASGTFRGDLQSSNYLANTRGWQILRDGTVNFNTGTFRADVQSSNYSAGSAGWKISRNGNAEFQNGTFRGDILASSVTANSITTTSLQSNSVTNSTLGFNAGSYTLTSAYTDVITATITSQGYPIVIQAGASSAGTYGDRGTIAPVIQGVKLLRDSTTIWSSNNFATAGGQLPTILFVDTPSAGSHTYHFQAAGTASTTISLSNRTLLVTEFKR